MPGDSSIGPVGCSNVVCRPSQPDPPSIPLPWLRNSASKIAPGRKFTPWSSQTTPPSTRLFAAKPNPTCARPSAPGATRGSGDEIYRHDKAARSPAAAQQPGGVEGALILYSTVQYMAEAGRYWT